jgi:hypothetical protein
MQKSARIYSERSITAPSVSALESSVCKRLIRPNNPGHKVIIGYEEWQVINIVENAAS